MPRRLALALVFAASLGVTGCFEFVDRAITNPNPTITMFGGTWRSQTPDSGALLNSCAGFQWQATQKTATVLAGNFSATCFQVFQVTGTVQATIAGSTITWTASASANGACVITLAGTGTIAENQLTLTYTGDSCQGPISGTEVLVKS
ncbi:MAG: hypothetical protein IT184_00185 [Acidobacteria bacterium]|nr:hypothetical protein [Acidobacteriota bacterium]